MDKPIPDELNVAGFETYIADFSDELKGLFSYLRSTAKNAGASVSDQRHKPNSGCGVRYYTRGERFCEIDPKVRENHAWVFLHGADRATLVAAGFEPSEQEGWFKVRTMPEAVHFVKWILEAHDRRA
jgi:hypothetical protein